MHGAGGYLEDNGATMPRSDSPGGVQVGGQVDVVPRHLQQPVSLYIGEYVLGRTVIQHIGRRDRLQLQIHLHRVALIGPDQSACIIE
jgi:hypothetical protein